MLAAVLERQKYVKSADGRFVQPPRPNQALFFNRLREFTLRLRRNTPRVARISREQFLSETPPNKFKVYQNAVESLTVEPLTVKDSHIKAFPKYEKLVKVPGKKLVPRCISPRSPRFNVEIGTFIRPMEKRIYAGIARVFRGATVSKGHNAIRMAETMWRKWNRYRRPAAVGLDASRFDQHVSVVALRWSHMVYLSLCATDRKIFEGLLRRTLRNKCTYSSADGFIKWVSEGGRMSGDMDTALGNCLIMCALVWSYCRSVGIDPNLYNNGDDCVVFMEEDQVPRFVAGLEEWFLEMGFKMKVEKPVFRFEHIEFCQTHPLDLGTERICVRNFPTCIDKDLVSVLPIDNEKSLDNYYASIGKGGLALAGGVPILTNFYSMLIRISRGAIGFGDHPTLRAGMIYMSQGMDRVHSEPTPEARVSFYEAFGVTPDEQVYWEKFYDDFQRPGLGEQVSWFPLEHRTPYLSAAS